MEFCLLAIAYLLGSIPTGYLVGRMTGIDIRKYGSGSTGAANVWRTIGRDVGIFVFVFDLLKGATAIALMQYINEINKFSNQWSTGDLIVNLTTLHEWFVVGAALLVLLGHGYSCWIGFKGGKSVATGLGVLLALNWMVALGAFSLWLATIGIWRTTSIGSISTAIVVPFLMVLTHSGFTYITIACFGSIFVICRHHSNIKRLCHGTEPRINLFDSKNHESISTN